MLADSADSIFDTLPDPLPTDLDALELLLSRVFILDATHNITNEGPALPADKLSDLRAHHRKVFGLNYEFLQKHDYGTLKSATLRAHWLDLRSRSFKAYEVEDLFFHIRERAMYLSKAQNLCISKFQGLVTPWWFVQLGKAVPKDCDELFLVMMEAEIGELKGEGKKGVGEEKEGGGIEGFVEALKGKPLFG